MSDWELDGETGMTREQQKLFNAACGDLATQVPWHGGLRLSKDDYRHMIAGSVMGWRTMPGIYDEHGQRGWIMLGGSSLDLSKSQATTCIKTAFHIGDNPSTQDLDADPVRWCDVICLARGITDMERAA